MDLATRTEQDVSQTGLDKVKGLGGGGNAAAKRDRRAMDSTLVKALAWTGGIKWAVQVVSWASMLVMARLLTPSDYGIIGMAGVYILTVSYIAECGIGTAIITAHEVSESQLFQMNTVAVMLGMVAMVLSWAVAKPLSWFYHTPVIAPLLTISSVTMLTESFRSVPYACLSKQLQFRFLALAEAVRAFVFTAVSLALAFLGLRYWSLVTANVVASLVVGVIVLRKARISYQRPSWAGIRDLMLVGRNIMIGSLAWYGYSNADFFIAGRLLGPASLGAYANAWTIATAPIEKVASVANRVTPSFFSVVGDNDAECRRYLLRITELLALLVLPIFCGAALVSTDFVHLAFGRRWDGMIMPLRLLAIYAALSCLTSLLTPVMNAKGHAAYSRNISLFAFLLLPPAFYAGGRLYGTVGIAGAWVALYPLVALRAYTKAFRIVHMNRRDYFASLAPALTGSAIMTAVVCLVKLGLPTNVSLLPRFAIVVLAGAVSYCAALLLLHRPTVNRVLKVISLQRHGSQEASQ